RDKLVTGVQTCALPIYFVRRISDQKVSHDGISALSARASHEGFELLFGVGNRVSRDGGCSNPRMVAPAALEHVRDVDRRRGNGRSEERRVGKVGEGGGG